MKLFYFINEKKLSILSILCGLFLFTNNHVYAQNSCDYTIELFDTFGDGWNGSILNVSVGGVSTDYTFDTGNSATFAIPANVNDALVFTYSPGAFEFEVSYNILDSNGNIVFSDGNPGPPVIGVVFSTFACPTCLGPTTYTVDGVTSSTADVTWESVDSVVSYIVELGFASFIPGSGIATTNAPVNSTTFSGLDENTNYEFYVQTICENGDTSGVSGPFSFLTTFDNPCNYTLELFDSFGDGWNGSILNVSVGGIGTDYTFTTGFDTTFVINAGSNLSLIFTYTAGAFQNEVSYNILDPDGNIIFSDGFNDIPATGLVFSTFACPTCPGPLSYTVDNISSTDATVSWELTDSVVSYNVEYGLVGFFPGNGIATTSTTVNTTSFSGLTEITNYEFYVQTICENGDTSGLAGPFLFLTTFDSPCNYTLNLFDSADNGWNGASLNVVVGGLAGVDYTIPFGSGAETFTITAGKNIPMVFTYTNGFLENQVSYEILNPSGNVIFSDGPNPATGVVFETPACPDCPGALNLMVDNTYGTAADLGWVVSDSVGIYEIEYGPTGFTPGTGTFITTSNPNITITGLDEVTTYDFYVHQDCTNGATSIITGPQTFSTTYLDDVGIVGITSPVEGCNLGVETISVLMQNFGSNPQSLIPFFYSVNGVAAQINVPLDGFFTDVIGKDSIMVAEFEIPYDFSGPGIYEIAAWTELDSDSDVSNDTVFFSFETYKALPLREDFEAVPGIPEDWVSDGQVGDDHNNISNVIFSNLWPGNQDFEIISPPYAIAAGDTMIFDYRYTDWSLGTVGAILGPNDSLQIQASIDCGMTYSTIFTIDETNHTISAELATVEVDISSLAGEVVQFRWFATYGSGDYWLDIDNINIWQCSYLNPVAEVTPESVAGAGDGAITVDPSSAGPYIFSWSNGETTETITGLSEGTYTVSVVDVFGCTNELEVTLDIFVNTAKIEKLKKISLAPNPTTDIAILDMEFSENIDLKVEVLNVMGQIIFETNKDNTTEERIDINMSDFASGIYFVRVSVDNQTVVKKLMKGSN